MRDIKNIVANTIAIICVGLLFLFAFTWIIFNFQSSATSLKDTWSIVSSLFGGMATLAAAYIASILFNDWREEADFHARKDFAAPVLELLALIKYELRKSQEVLINLRLIDSCAFLNTKYSESVFFNPKKDIFKLTPNVKYLNKYKNKDVEIDISEEYASLERHITHIGDQYINVMSEYNKYYNTVIDLGGLDKSKIYFQPHNTYENLRIVKPSDAIKDLRLKITQETGFYIFNQSKEELVKYENIEEMIKETIVIIDKIETFLLSKHLMLNN